VTTSKTKTNQLARTVANFECLPSGLRSWAISLALGRVVPLVGTAGLRYEEITPQRVVVSIRNQRKVQNHIKGVHAAAMALLAETATGFCVGMNLPDDKLPLIKTMKIDYVRRSQGDMVATAQLRPEQVQQIFTLDKGEVTVPVTITDEAGQQPILAEMVWAWVPKKKI
jgi:acyl-coenzyme A thioesterase PaaI-like protein